MHKKLVLFLMIMFSAFLSNAQSVVVDEPISSRFSADPSAHFFNGKFYIYATNDQDNSGKYWDSTDWRLFSSSDLKKWKDEGSFLSVSVFSWAGKAAKAWAPGAIEHKGKFYFYAPVGGTQIGVVVSDFPRGPFKDPIGYALVDKSRDKNAGDEPIDPMIFIDKDAQAYMYFGTRNPKVVKLTDDLIHLNGDIHDIEIKGFPKEDAKKQYGEAPHLHLHNGVYYFSFSTGWPGQIVYATGASPMGPFNYRGVILDYLPISTNHHAILERDGRTHIFYHDNSLAGGGDFKRAIRVADLNYSQNGDVLPLYPYKK